MNKKAYSTGFGWIMTLVVICLGGLLFIILNQVYTEYITPAFGTLINTSIGEFGFTAGNASVLQAEAEKFNYFWTSIPIILLLLMCVYLVINAIRSKQKDE